MRDRMDWLITNTRGKQANKGNKDSTEQLNRKLRGKASPSHRREKVKTSDQVLKRIRFLDQLRYHPNKNLYGLNMNRICMKHC